MSILPIGLGSVVCLALLAGQPPVQQAKEKMTVEGTVVDASTGLPIERALVTFGQERLFTGPDGRFAFQTDATPRYSLISAVRPGYERGRDLKIPTQARQPVTVKLKRYAEITGKVLNEDAEAVQGLRVQAFRRTIELGRVRLWPSSFWTTDDLGFFRLAEMPAGDYLVRVTGRQSVMAYLGERGARAPNSSEAYTAQYHPGVADQSAAQVLTMEPGQALQVDFMIPSRPAVSIRGRIVNHVAYQSVALELSRPGELPIGNRVGINSANGEFEMVDVPPGQYELTAKRTINKVEERRRIAVQVGNTPLDGVSVTLVRPVDIDVRIQGGGSEGGPRRRIWLELTPTESRSDEAPELWATEGVNGELGLKGVWPGNYRVGARSQMVGYYVAAVMCGGVDILRGGLSVAEGTVPPPIEVQLAPGPSQLEITVTAEGRPFPLAQVLLQNDSGEWSRLNSEPETGSEGAIIVGGLAPGTYGLLAVPETLEIEYGNATAMERFASRIKRISIRGQSKETLQLELVREAQN